MAAASILSALEPWGVSFTPEGVAAFEQSGIVSVGAAKEYVLSSDLRRLHLAPHPADPTNFSAILSKSLQAPPEVAAYAATNPATSGPAPDEQLVGFNSCLRKPVLCMIISFQDVRLPTKDVEEDFADGAHGIKGNKRRLLSLKLTDGRGASFTGIELRFCPQLDAVPLVPGVKLLLLPGLVFYRGMALLSPQHVQSLGGGAAQLREAFNLKADVQERRKLVQHILKENTQLQQRIKEDKSDTGPPRFVPFSFSANVQNVELRSEAATRGHQQQKTDANYDSLKRTVECPEQACGEPSTEPAPRSLLMSTNAGNLKQDRLRQLEKVNPNTVKADRISLERTPGRGGRGRRERRRRDEDMTEYMRPSGVPVTYSLFDLIKADAEQTNSTAATAILYASEPYGNEDNHQNAVPQADAAFPPAFQGGYGASPPGASRKPTHATDASLGAPGMASWPESFRTRGHRGGGRGRGRGRGRGTR